MIGWYCCFPKIQMIDFVPTTHIHFKPWFSLLLITYSIIWYAKTRQCWLYFGSISFHLWHDLLTFFIHDIIYRDLFIFINFRYLISSSKTYKFIVWENPFRVFISSSELSFLLALILVLGFLYLKLIDPPCFMHG